MARPCCFSRDRTSWAAWNSSSVLHSRFTPTSRGSKNLAFLSESWDNILLTNFILRYFHFSDHCLHIFLNLDTQRVERSEHPSVLLNSVPRKPYRHLDSCEREGFLVFFSSGNFCTNTLFFLFELCKSASASFGTVYFGFFFFGTLRRMSLRITIKTWKRIYFILTS